MLSKFRVPAGMAVLALCLLTLMVLQGRLRGSVLPDSEAAQYCGGDPVPVCDNYKSNQQCEPGYPDNCDYTLRLYVLDNTGTTTASGATHVYCGSLVCSLNTTFYSNPTACTVKSGQ